MKVEEVNARVAALADAPAHDAAGHIEEDSIREDVLKAIAAGAENPAALAAAALRTGDYDFPRYYD